MVASGLVPSLARPGGNLTGISILATELDGKRQEILMELVPASRRMAALVDPSVTAPPQLETLRNAAAMRGVELSIYPVRGPDEIAATIERAQTAGATALNVLASPILNANRKIILDRSVALRLPAIYQWPETAEEGGLIAYGPPITKVFRRLSDQLVTLLRGAKPADLPVEQPTEFELVVNLKTAKALGLRIPQTILARADEVIE
jgi:putative ABC transport system substrate-binding protein